MVGIFHEEHNNVDLKANITHLEQSIASLTKIVTQFLVMKNKEGCSREIEHEEDKGNPEDSKGKKLGDSSKNISLPSYSNIPFKFEVKFEILEYDDQVNIEILNRWLKHLGV